MSLSRDSIRQKIKGPVFSILTPFDPISEEIDYLSLDRVIETIHHAGGTVFYAMAYNSRYCQMSWEEIRNLNRYVIRKVKELDPGHVVIVGDPPHCSTRTTIEFAIESEKAGADIISLLIRERFYSEQQIYRHFEMVAEATEMNLLIHEMPFLDGFGGPPVNWPVSLLDRVVDLPSVVAIKEDAKNDDYSREVVRTLCDRVSIIISGGDQSQWIKFVDDGCQAWLIGIGVFEPRLAVKFYNNWIEGNTTICQRIIDEVERPFFNDAVKPFGWHLAIKAALEARGMMSRHDRMPLMPLSEEQVDVVKLVIDRMPLQELLAN